MSKEDFLAMVLGERIDMLTKRERSVRTKSLLEEAEAVIDALPENEKEKIKSWLNLSMDLEAENLQKAYLGGLTDGIWLAGMVYMAGAEGMLDLERWAEKFALESSR